MLTRLGGCLCSESITVPILGTVSLLTTCNPENQGEKAKECIIHARFWKLESKIKYVSMIPFTTQNKLKTMVS